MGDFGGLLILGIIAFVFFVPKGRREATNLGVLIFSK
jgi:hypothetical protein